MVGGLAIELFLGGEAFDAEDVELTTQLLVVFALAVPFEAASHLLSRAVYSTRNTILPVAASLIGLGVTVGTVLVLAPELDMVALPSASSPVRPRRWRSCSLPSRSGCAAWVGLIRGRRLPRPPRWQEAARGRFSPVRRSGR